MRSLPLWLAAVWAFSLTTLGLFVVPMLFMHLPTPAMAGTMAAKLFSVQTWISVVCGIALLAAFRSNRPLAPVHIAQAATLFVVAGVLLALLVEFGVSPRIVARDNWRCGIVWQRHVLCAVVCALVVFGKLAGARSAEASE